MSGGSDVACRRHFTQRRSVIFGVFLTVYLVCRENNPRNTSRVFCREGEPIWTASPDISKGRPLMTECTQERFEFTAHFSRRVEAGFSAGQVSSDGGGLLLREVDRKIKLVKRVAGCFSDGRSAERVEHTLEEMLSQRIFGLALGYEDLNDHEQLRSDPLLGASVRRGRSHRQPGASELAAGEYRAARRLRLQAQVDTIRLKLLKIGTIVRFKISVPGCLRQ